MLLLNDTTICGIQIAMYLALHEPEEPTPPRIIAGELGLSSSYCAKVAGLLVRTGILRSHRGTRGGVELERPPEAITLFDIAEACQGRILGRQCGGNLPLKKVCAFHRAMFELQESTVSVLSRWSIAHLTRRPFPSGDTDAEDHCVMMAVAADR